MPFNAAVKLLDVKRTKNFGESRNLNRGYWRNPQHWKWRCIVAQQQRATNPGSPGQALVAKRKLPIMQIDSSISVKQLKLIDPRKRCRSRCSHFVSCRNELNLRGRQSRGCR